MGPGSRKHCWGRDGPIEGWSRTPGSQRGVVGEVVVKPNTAGGSMSSSKSGSESVYYYFSVQYSWSIHSPRDQEPKPTRVVGRPKGWVGSFLPLNQEITGSAAQQGWCPRSAACNSWCIHRLCLMGECATTGTGAGRPDGPI